jgi:hypothetical protein
MPVEVIVKLADAAADTAAHRTLHVCARDAGVTIAPLHPAATDRDLSTWYVARVEPHAVDDVIARFRACAGVEAAYAKPSAEPPAGRM